MELIGLVTVFLAVTAAAFVVSVRLGILMGYRLDRAMEARAAAGDLEATQLEDGAIGREEDRGE
jgi:hypothetical protein